MGVLKESDPKVLDIMSPKNLSTIGGDGESRCSLDYTPAHQSETMIYAILVAFN
jgi:hypothetical protein